MRDVTKLVRYESWASISQTSLSLLQPKWSATLAMAKLARKVLSLLHSFPVLPALCGGLPHLSTTPSATQLHACRRSAGANSGAREQTWHQSRKCWDTVDNQVRGTALQLEERSIRGVRECQRGLKNADYSG